METLFLYGRKFPDIKSQQNTQIYNGHDFISCFTINSLNAVIVVTENCTLLCKKLWCIRYFNLL